MSFRFSFVCYFGCCTNIIYSSLHSLMKLILALRGFAPTVLSLGNLKNVTGKALKPRAFFNSRNMRLVCIYFYHWPGKLMNADRTDFFLTCFCLWRFCFLREWTVDLQNNLIHQSAIWRNLVTVNFDWLECKLSLPSITPPKKKKQNKNIPVRVLQVVCHWLSPIQPGDVTYKCVVFLTISQKIRSWISFSQPQFRGNDFGDFVTVCICMYNSAPAFVQCQITSSTSLITFDLTGHIAHLSLSLSACLLLILQLSLLSHSSKIKSRALPHFLPKLFLLFVISLFLFSS
jgi:hypothetical protein